MLLEEKIPRNAEDLLSPPENLLFNIDLNTDKQKADHLQGFGWRVGA